MLKLLLIFHITIKFGGRMSKLQYYSSEHRVKLFLKLGKEGDCWDFKQEWHEDMHSLIKDIICFANTVHDENCYIIFGISDNLQITGMNNARRKQADIIEAISNLHFAGDNYPKISVETIKSNHIELDILTIYNTSQIPIYLKKTYGKMREGCIYLRIEDKNTPDNGNADITDIEHLWRKRLGLTKPPLEYIYDRLYHKIEWTENKNCFYNIYKPEYTIEIVSDEVNNLNRDEFYSYAMTNESTSFKILNIKYQQTILDSYQIVTLDSGRLSIPVPELGFIYCDEHRNNYSYKYYILDSKCYCVLNFMYDQKNGEECIAFRNLQNVVLFYKSNDERKNFEFYLKKHIALIKNTISTVDTYNYITTDEEKKTVFYKKQLHTGIAFNQLLIEWRQSNAMFV